MWSMVKWFGALTGIAVTVIGLFWLLTPTLGIPPEYQRQMGCRNNLKQIGIALHLYNERWQCLPPAYTVNSRGTRLHSWRVLILPYLGQKKLYQSIDLSKPWDDPVNRAAMAQRVPEYECPQSQTHDGKTTYLACVGNELAFAPDRGRTFHEFADGISDSALVVEGTQPLAVHWMVPNDLDLTTALSVLASTSRPHRHGAHVLLADGAVRWFSIEQKPTILQHLMTIADGHGMEN